MDFCIVNSVNYSHAKLIGNDWKLVGQGFLN